MKKLIDAIQDHLRVNGFKKKRTTYILELSKSFFVIEIQKSRFSEIFYINYGFYFVELESAAFDLKFESCHLINRFSPFSELNLSEFKIENFDALLKYIIKKIDDRILPLVKGILTADEALMAKILNWETLEAQHYKAIEIVDFIKKEYANKK